MTTDQGGRVGRQLREPNALPGVGGGGYKGSLRGRLHHHLPAVHARPHRKGIQLVSEWASVPG